MDKALSEAYKVAAAEAERVKNEGQDKMLSALSEKLGLGPLFEALGIAITTNADSQPNKLAQLLDLNGDGENNWKDLPGAEGLAIWLKDAQGGPQ